MCSQVLKGSHKVGRIDHGRVGGQTGADMERVEEIMKVQGAVVNSARFFTCLYLLSLLLSFDPRSFLLFMWSWKKVMLSSSTAMSSIVVTRTTAIVVAGLSSAPTT